MATNLPLDPHPLSSQRYGLAIHTASTDLGLAISNFVEPSRSQTWALGRDVSNYLQTYLQTFLQPQTWSDLAFIAVAKGPGGFTGTRLGVVTARTLAQQLDLPLYAVSTLAAVAWANHPLASDPLGSDSLSSDSLGSDRPQPDPVQTDPSQPEPADIAVQMLAQRGEVHGAIYSVQADGPLKALLPDAVMNLRQWQQRLADWQRPYRLIQVEGNLGATVTSLLQLAYCDWQKGLRPHWSEALPFYGQSPV